MSNFDQFFAGLPISLYERPHRTPAFPPSADQDVVRLVPVPRHRINGVSSVPTLNIWIGTLFLLDPHHTIPVGP